VYEVSEDYFTLMNEYYNRHFITEVEYNAIKVVQSHYARTQLDYEIIHNLMRKRFILRWSANEIARDYKILVDHNNRAYKYYLNIAVQEKSAINVEGIYLNDKNMYVDCSNFFWLKYTNENGIIRFINLPNEMLDDKEAFFEENLKYSMFSLLYSQYPSTFSPFKCVKRFFSYARHFEDPVLLKKAYAIINSQYGRLYNMNSQIKTLIKLIQTSGVKYINMEALYNQIDMIRWNIQGIIIDDFNNDEPNEIFEDILKKGYNFEILAHKLKDASTYLSEFLNTSTIQILQNMKLYPLPKYLVPKNPPF
jgi:hypothetical protein